MSKVQSTKKYSQKSHRITNANLVLKELNKQCVRYNIPELYNIQINNYFNTYLHPLTFFKLYKKFIKTFLDYS